MLEKKTRGIVLAALGGIFWGFSGACGQFLFLDYAVDPLWLSAVRMLGAAPLLLLFCLMRPTWRRSLLGMVSEPRSVVRLLLAGIVGLCFVQVTYLLAIDYSNAATATVLQYIGPVMIVVLMCLKGRKLPSIKELLAVVCVVVGTFLLATHGDPGNLALSSEGLFWGLMAAVGVVFYSLLPAPLILRWDTMPVLAWCMIISAAITNVGVQPWTCMPELDVFGWLAVLAMVVFGTVCGFLFYLQGVADAGASTASLVSSIEVVSATVFAVVWLGTFFAPMDLLGFVLIMATVFLLHTAPEK